MNMYKKTLFLICMMSFIVFSVANGAVIPVGSGTDNSIPDAITTANAGDIIELTDTGPYLFTDQPSVDKDLTIRAQADLPEKPVLKYAGTSTSAKFFKLVENARLELSNLEFAGDGTDVGGAAKAKYVVTIENADPTKTAGLHVDGIVAHDFNDKFIKPYGDAGMDSLVVTNSIFYNGASEGIVLYSGTSSDPAAVIEYAEVSNSTFAAIEREAVKGQTNPTTKVRVERCTFYDLGAVDKKVMIYFRDMTDVIVKNSIFSVNNNPDLEKFADFDSSLSLFHNNVVWDVTNAEVGTATVTDTIHMDPGFADPANLDFTLPTDSPLLTFADDGGAVGDPRWVVLPEPVVHEVSPGTNGISDAYALAASGDIIELVGVGDYLTDVQLTVDKNITIRGREGLPSKPVLKYVGTSTSAKFFKLIENARLELENLEFAGDGTADGGAAKAKYVVTIENADPTMKAELIVNDIVAHDFNDKFIKPYANAGMDSLVVTNSIFYNGASEGIVLYSGTSSDPAVVIGYAEISNSTFYNIEREAIKGQTNPTTKVLVDRCTFYDLGAVDKKAMIYFRDMTDVEVKNSIFAVNNNPDLEKFADFADATSLFHHNVVWDVVNAEVGGATVSDTIHMDPGFADPANADFTLPSGSPLLTFADDGGPVGDSRWAPLEGKVILTAYVVGKGSVTLDPPGGLYDEGTSVTITAVPDDMYQFDHWSPNVLVFPPNNPVAVLTLNESMEVTAYFVPSIQQYTVTYDAVGLGHVEEELISDFDVDGYWEGDTLILTAVPDTTTWVFVHWTDAEGNEVSTDNPMTYPVEADAHFTAVFNSTLPQVALNVDVVGLGDVDVFPKPVPGFDTYDQGQVVTLEAAANLGWEFTGWSGDVTVADAVIDVTLDTDKSLTATFNELAVPDGKLLVDASWDLRDALGFAKYNSNVEMIVLTETGPYMPSEEDRNNGKLPQLDIDFPVTIVGDEALADKPVIKAWGEGGSEGLFRLRTDGHLVLKNLDVDGTLVDDKKTKYIFRFDDGDSINVSVKADNVDMHGTLEAFLKFYALVHADTLSFTNCTVWDIGKEGIFDNAAGTSDYIEIKNSTFFDVGREILRLKMQTPEVVIDHVTVDSCGYGYGSEGDKFSAFKVENPNKTVITNSIISNVPNTIYGYSIRFYSDESIIDNTLMYNTAEIDNNDGSVVGPNVFWYDPMFAYTTSNDFTLQDNSVAYHLADDGSAAIGDLRWATSTNITDYKALNLTVGKNGKVGVSPEPMAKFYTPGTAVTLTAEADTLYKFAGWSGDLVSANAVETLTMDADKSVTAAFEEAYYEITLNVNMSVWADAGKFTVGSDSVDVAGNFNNWGDIPVWMDDTDGDTVYTAVVKIDENHPNMEWKFRINGSWDDATAEFPFGGPARTYTATGDESLTFWYNDDVAPEGITNVLPLEYELNQNYPNPFNPTTTIRFGLPEAGHAKIVLYDLRGQEVMTLIDTNMPAGYHDVNLNGSHLASGVYFYRIKAGNYTAVRKLMLLK